VGRLASVSAPRIGAARPRGLRGNLLSWLLLVLLGAVSVGAAGLAIFDPGAVDWGALSLILVVAVVGLAMVAYGLRDAHAGELSLIAALAALATAGRVLFASLPNFKPVTFIVLVSGIALGPAPGFMVGATTAVVSNLFFGQGPWTPWQMLGWGLVGVVGGLMGLGGRRPGRWEIVLVGAALSVGFDWFVSIWMFLTYTPRTWPALVALCAQGLPFDAAHLMATSILAAVFGPRAVAIIARFRARTSTTFVSAPPRPGGSLLRPPSGL
jgi:energy-coupling factor transport system substrate-specific component